MDYSQAPINHNFGLDVDEFIRLRETSKYNLTRAKMALLATGAKTITDGVLQALPNLDLERFEKCQQQEFYWEAEYKDGSVLKQFDGARQHHFGHIEQDKLKLLRWVSNFSAETSNADKRVIVTLDWETGAWSFYNGLVLQETKAFLESKQFPKDAKLILKMTKRESGSAGFPGGDTGELTLYKRYLLGWESGDDKVLVCVEPNGYAHLWHQ